jgi:imidazolonepropionase-like amidohydrolase
MIFRFLLLAVAAAGAASAATVLHCGKFVDVVSLSVRENVSITVEAGRIQSISVGFTAGEAIDLKSHTCMPGLMDMHVHLTGESNPKSYEERFRLNPADHAYRSVGFARKTLLAGVTTVRDVGTRNGVSISLRNAIQQGLIDGPRIFAAGTSLATTGGHADPTNGVRADLLGDPGPKEGVVNGIEDASKAVRQRYKEGADLIKITATGGVLSVAASGENPQFTEQEIRAIVDTAKDYGFHVAAHAHGAEGMKRAIRAGIHSIEHGTLMDDEAIALFKQKGTWWVPTISAGQFVAAQAEIPGYYPDVVKSKALAIGPKSIETFRKAYVAGVKIAMGTDCGVSPHGSNARELVYMNQAGMPPLETIQASTLHGAQLLGIETEVGTLETGKLADIIATPEDPRQDLSTVTRVSFVMKHGKVYKRP